MNSEKENTIFVDIFNKNSEKDVTKYGKAKFIIQKSKKGRKKKNIIKNESSISQAYLNSKIHSKYRDDNIRNKIFTHFIFFIISFLNDYGKQFIHKKKILFFKGISYKFRQKLNFDTIKIIMSYSIKEFCNLPVSTKHKNCVNLNAKSFKLLSKFFDEEFTNMKICNLYQYFYYPNNLDLIKTYFGLSDEIENFEKLLEKYNNDIEYRKKLKKNGENLLNFCIEDFYFYFNLNYYIKVGNRNNILDINFEDYLKSSNLESLNDIYSENRPNEYILFINS